MTNCSVLVLFTVAVCALCLLSPQVTAIRCFKCDHNEVSSGNNFILSFILRQISKVDHPECKMTKRRDRNFVDIIECPPPSDWGSKYVCGTVRGTISGTWQDLEVQFDTLTRDCIQVPAGEASYANRCVESSMIDGPTQFLLQEALEALGDFDLENNVDFKGKTCYDTHGVPIENHQMMCPTCSYNELLSVNSLLGPLVDAFNENNEESCRLQNHGDKFHIGFRFCKPSYQGAVNKCVMAEGEVSTKLLRGVGGGIDVRYNTVTRGCAKVDLQGRDREKYRDGCHTNLPFSQPVRQLLVQGYKGASSEMGDMRFTGKVCYNNETFSAEQPNKYIGEKEDSQTPSAASLYLPSTLQSTATFIITVLLSFGKEFSRDF